MNKAAGVSVKDWLIKYHKARICRYKHAPLRMLPEKHYGKMKIGCVRDPFDWYVSYFNYLCQEKRITTLNFKRFVEIYVRHPRALFDFMGSKVRKQFENLYPPKTDLPIGGWTFHFINYFFFDSRKILRGELPCRFENHNMEYLMKTENLKEDMIRVFGDYYQKSIIKWPHKNKSKRRQKNYWTPDLRKLIIEREKDLMEYLGYTD
jgi:hypothetical protein